MTPASNAANTAAAATTISFARKKDRIRATAAPAADAGTLPHEVKTAGKIMAESTP